MIRSATAADDLSDLLSQLGYPFGADVVQRRLKRVLADEAQAVFVAVNGSDLAGFIHIDTASGLEYDAVGRIRALIVGEAHRNAHLGEELLARAEEWARGRELSTIVVYSNVIRTRARKFYERLGYAVVKTSNIFEKHLA